MTQVFLCTESSMAVPAIDLPNMDIVEIRELCADPRQILSRIADEESSLIFLVHRRSIRLGSLQAAVRQLGFDPLGIGVVDLDSLVDGEQARVALAAASAQVGVFRGSVPEQVKLLPSERKTRRSFLSLGAPVYIGAPKIIDNLCVAGDGCRACVIQCPADALDWSGGAISYDINSCVACGICLTTCPVGAIVHPTGDARVVESGIAAALKESERPLGIRYRCRDAFVPGERGWHQVEVPCTGMLTVGWLLSALLIGAADVDAVPCGVGGCRLGNDRRLESTLEDLGVVRIALRERLDRIGSFAAGGDGWLEARSTGRALAELADLHGGLSLDLRSADVGLVAIDQATCTACEMCARVCPTGALESRVARDGIHISFDPTLCVACGQCVTTCPEVDRGAISMSHGFDVGEWQLGRREVRFEPTPACEICGGAVAPAAMLDRIREVLGDDSPEIALIGRRCISCRGR